MRCVHKIILKLSDQRIPKNVKYGAASFELVKDGEFSSSGWEDYWCLIYFFVVVIENCHCNTTSRARRRQWICTYNRSHIWDTPENNIFNTVVDNQTQQFWYLVIRIFLTNRLQMWIQLVKICQKTYLWSSSHDILGWPNFWAKFAAFSV